MRSARRAHRTRACRPRETTRAGWGERRHATVSVLRRSNERGPTRMGRLLSRSCGGDPRTRWNPLRHPSGWCETTDRVTCRVAPARGAFGRQVVSSLDAAGGTGYASARPRGDARRTRGRGRAREASGRRGRRRCGGEAAGAHGLATRTDPCGGRIRRRVRANPRRLRCGGSPGTPTERLRTVRAANSVSAQTAP